VGEVVEAYAAGFEAMGALARASHPALYDAGWHPTAVCGSVGAAVAAGRLLELEGDRLRSASRLALLQAGGMRAAFGSDGKSMQVGMAAAAGVYAAHAAARGASVSRDVARAPAGFAEVFGGTWAEPDPGDPAIARNWIKPWPCCLMAHSAIHAAVQARGDGIPEGVEVVVHPRARQAAVYDDVETGLEAKFSIPYLVAYTFLRGEPARSAFEGIEEDVRDLGRRVTVRVDAALGESAARVAGIEVAHSPGSPDSPLSVDQLAAKVRDLAGDRLDGLLDDPDRPAADLLAVYE
jgi:2-methylcitrate dehydratase PrpD